VDEKRRFGYWKDTGVKVTGGAVNSFTRIFLETWIAFKEKQLDGGRYLITEEFSQKSSLILPYADTPLDDISVGEYVYLDMIHRATKRLWVMTPYLVLDEFLRLALADAAARGVDVRIVTPGVPDKKIVYRMTRANYPALLKAGVRIFEYTPGFLHAKAVLADDCAVVGTINLDFRSLYHHFENAVYFSSTGAVQTLEEDFEEVFAVSKEQAVGKKRSVFSRLFVSALRLIEPLM
jgi:cardiolipin synthase